MSECACPICFPLYHILTNWVGCQRFEQDLQDIGIGKKIGNFDHQLTPINTD